MSKSGYGKIKGSNYERKICKKLSLWVSYGEKDDIFWRSAMSGGRTTLGLKKGIKRNNQAGDITAIDPIGQFLIDKYIIECKFYKNIQLQSMIFGIPKNNSIYEFWNELQEKASNLHKQMILIIKQNKFPELMGISHWGDFKSILEDYYEIKPIAIFNETNPPCCLYELDYILNITDPINFK